MTTFYLVVRDFLRGMKRLGTARRGCENIGNDTASDAVVDVDSDIGGENGPLLVSLYVGGDPADELAGVLGGLI